VIAIACQQNPSHAHLSRKCFWAVLEPTVLKSMSSTFPFRNAILSSNAPTLVSNSAGLAMRDSNWELALFTSRKLLKDSSAEVALKNAGARSFVTLLDRSSSNDRPSVKISFDMPIERSKALDAASLIGGS
jgi:hypothetical protein